MPSGTLKGWLWETASIYHVGILRLGVGHILMGTISLFLGVTLMAINSGHPWSGLGIYVGLPTIATGTLCLVNRKRRPWDKISPTTLFCTFSVMCSAFLLISSAANIYGVATDIDVFYPNYILPDITWPLYAINSVLIALSLFGVWISVWSASLSLGLICMCCKQEMSPVFTIQCNENENNTGGSFFENIQQPELEWDTEDVGYEHNNTHVDLAGMEGLDLDFEPSFGGGVNILQIDQDQASLGSVEGQGQ